MMACGMLELLSCHFSIPLYARTIEHAFVELFFELRLFQPPSITTFFITLWPTMTTAIRPVTGRWPSASSVWDETSLPLACVIKPYSRYAAKLPLCAIPKCLKCGAPQQDITHYPVHAGSSILCHLCGKITSRLYQDQVLERTHETLDEATYRRRGVPDSVFQLPLHDTVYSVPAMSCPPIWWIVVDGSISEREYWNILGTTLRHVCKDMPSYVHVGLLVSTSSSLAVWDLSSAVPHVKHYEWNCPISLVPSPTTSNLQAALRALGDMGGLHQKNTKGVPLSATLQVILDSMQSTSHPGNNRNKNVPKYAGGRILCILGGQAPVEVKSRRRVPSGETGSGGFGGSCATVGKRYTRTSNNTIHPRSASNGDPELGGGTSNRMDSLSHFDETDMTATNLSKLYRNTSAELYYSEIGQQCAYAAFGVDVLVLSSNKNTDVGIPFLRQLADCSGAPGPILCTDAHKFEQQVSSRTPWKNDTVFGGKLRIRTSPGFSVDSTEVEGTGDEGPQLAPLYSSAGVMGPATSSDDDGLWLLGSCDTHTALTVDFVMKKSVPDRVYVDGMGDVPIKHAIQTCFAFTCIEKQDDGSLVTVRRMKIASLHLPLAHDTESLYATLDPEALAVTLFHKLTIASLQDGLVQTHDIGQQWLHSLLSCVYKSAEKEDELQKEQISRGLDNMNPVFYPQERLLNGNGELSAEDVLLGQGHDRVSTVPFMVFALLQCDALRPSMGSYQPSIDARSAASAQMYSMLPSVLARCIAPRLELWSSNDAENEPITEDLDLNLERVGMHVMEHRQTGSADSLLLFVDSPREIVVYDSRHIQPNVSETSKAAISKGLERCIEIAIKTYRIAPPVAYELSLDSSFAISRFKDILVEDSQTIQGLPNFMQWKQDVAAMVQE